MKSDLNVCELLQLILEQIDDNADYFKLGYASCIRDLAKMIKEDPSQFGLK